MVEASVRTAVRCDLCDTPLRLESPDPSKPGGIKVMEFTAHTAEYCREMTKFRISNLTRYIEQISFDLRASEHARHFEAVNNRKLRDQLDERTYRTHLPVPDRDGERRFWKGSNGAVSYSTVAKDSVTALKFLIDHEIQCGVTDETHEMGVEEVTAEKAATVQIGGDEPTILSAMPYGDVASSEY